MFNGFSKRHDIILDKNGSHRFISAVLHMNDLDAMLTAVREITVYDHIVW